MATHKFSIKYIFLSIFCSCLLVNSIMAQTPVPPDPDAHGGSGGNHIQEDTIILEDRVVTPAHNLCWDATNSITAAGSGTTFIVENGAWAEFIAGDHITLKDGFHAHDGSYFKASIGGSCPPPPTSPANNEMIDIENEMIKIYPNPCDGRFNIDFINIAPDQQITLYVYNLPGDEVFTKQIIVEGSLEMDFSYLDKGLYILKVNTGINSLFTKVIIK